MTPSSLPGRWRPIPRAEFVLHPRRPWIARINARRDAVARVDLTTGEVRTLWNATTAPLADLAWFETHLAVVEEGRPPRLLVVDGDGNGLLAERTLPATPQTPRFDLDGDRGTLWVYGYSYGWTAHTITIHHGDVDIVSRPRVSGTHRPSLHPDGAWIASLHVDHKNGTPYLEIADADRRVRSSLGDLTISAQSNLVWIAPTTLMLFTHYAETSVARIELAGDLTVDTIANAGGGFRKRQRMFNPDKSRLVLGSGRASDGVTLVALDLGVSPLPSRPLFVGPPSSELAQAWLDEATLAVLVETRGESASVVVVDVVTGASTTFAVPPLEATATVTLLGVSEGRIVLAAAHDNPQVFVSDAIVSAQAVG